MTDYEWIIADGAGDVHLSAAERRDVYGCPLFLCPKAVDAAVNLGVSAIDKMVSVAQHAGVLPKDDRLGRHAISHVVGCRPTLYQKLRDTCNVINWHHVTRLGQPAPISGCDIIICGFRLRDFTKNKETLGLTDEVIAKRANVDLALVKTLTANYRAHLSPVLGIYAVLYEAAMARSAAKEDTTELRLLKSGDMRQSVIIDRKPYTNIQKVGTSDMGADVYALHQDNVVPAPRRGHPWAIGADGKTAKK